jgi:hypothetical protein
MAYKISRKSLAVGTRVEHEHLPTINRMKSYHQKTGKCMPNKKIYESIATDHIKEFPKGYYSELAKMENKLKSKNK